MKNDKEKIIERVRKLLAMAQDSSSPNEAAIAAGRARSLMDKHQLELEDISESDGLGEACSPDSYKRYPDWKQHIATALSRLNDCRVVFAVGADGRKRLKFQGFEMDVEVCIWKCPVVEMTRSKALGLLHKTVKKDSAMSRMGIPDYVVVMRKPGENSRPVAGEFKYYIGDNPPNGFNLVRREDGSSFWVPGDSNTSVDVWQKYASPVWDDINQTDTLNFREGRASDDERHICPLQLGVIERCIQLWSLPGDVVWTPFMGIGSEVYMAIKLGRRAIGVELKPSYYNLAVRNIEQAEKSQYSLF